MERSTVRSVTGRGAVRTTDETIAQGGAQIAGTPSKDHPGPGPRIMAASTLTRDKIVNLQGETLGDMQEIMLDVPRGRVAYAVLSAGGFLGMGERYFAIPWGALTLDIENKCFIVDIDRERLSNAPGFDKDNWPSTADERWSRDLYAYYNTPPYWE